MKQLWERFWDWVFDDHNTRLPQQFWDKLINNKFILSGGHVVCTKCSDQCGHCGTIRLQGRLQQQYDEWDADRKVKSKKAT